MGGDISAAHVKIFFIVVQTSGPASSMYNFSVLAILITKFLFRINAIFGGFRPFLLLRLIEIIVTIPQSAKNGNFSCLPVFNAFFWLLRAVFKTLGQSYC